MEADVAAAAGAFVVVLGGALAAALASGALRDGAWRQRALRLARERDEADAARTARLDALAETLRAIEGSAGNEVRYAHRRSDQLETERLDREERASSLAAVPSRAAVATVRSIDAAAAGLVVALLGRLAAEARYRWGVLQAEIRAVLEFKAAATATVTGLVAEVAALTVAVEDAVDRFDLAVDDMTGQGSLTAGDVTRLTDEMNALRTTFAALQAALGAGTCSDMLAEFGARVTQVSEAVQLAVAKCAAP